MREVKDSDRSLPEPDTEPARMSRRRFLAAAALVPVVVNESRATGQTDAAAKRTVTPSLAPTIPSAVAISTKAAGFVQHGPRSSRLIALTFHGAGIPSLAHQVLDTAHRMKVPLTVFAVGMWVDANPELARALQADGHELANHTFSHPSLSRLSRVGVANEIVGGADALRRATGTIGSWFRPSGTPVATRLMLEEAAKVGYATVVGYDVDPLDYQDPGHIAVADRTLAAVKGGSIVSLHLGHQGTADALAAIITGVRSLGLEPARVSTLLQP